jgi:hypothetical protein
MAYYTIKLLANKEFIQSTSGTLILVDSIGLADGVDITPIVNGAEQSVMPMRKAAFRYVTKFDSVKFRADVDCTIAVFLSNSDVNLGFADGAQVTLKPTTIGVNNDNDSPIPVQQQDLATIVDVNPVVVGTARVALISDPTLKRLRIRNSHASAKVAIGGAGVTLANSSIILLPGDVFFEDDAAGAPWFAISDTAGAVVQLQGLKK